MKILSLRAENVKRISVVEITPDGHLVQITGKNGQGKTSVLDAISWAIEGADVIQAKPIHAGADKAEITLDLGDYIVRRTFTRRADGDHTTSVRVESKDGGMLYRSPQQLLDGFMGALTFDPLAFAQLKPKDQFDALRRFVPDVDFEAVEAKNRADYEHRTEVNRDAKRARAAAEQIIVPPDLPSEPVDEGALVAELERAGQENGMLEARTARREAAQARIAELAKAKSEQEASHPGRLSAIATRRDITVSEYRQQIEALEHRLALIKDEAEVELEVEGEEFAAACAAYDQEAAELLGKLAGADALPAPIDTAALRQQIDAARTVNAGLTRRAERDRLRAQAEEAETRATALTDAMTARDQAKNDAIAAAKLPVPGIGFGDGVITLNGLPFDQASSAEQLRAAIAIAMASNPKLRVIRVRQGSLLDDDGMQLLAAEAERHDCQVWIERVDGSGKVGFVMEDGHLLGAPPPAEPEKPAKPKSSRWRDKPAAAGSDLLTGAGT